MPHIHEERRKIIEDALRGSIKEPWKVDIIYTPQQKDVLTIIAVNACRLFQATAIFDVRETDCNYQAVAIIASRLNESVQECGEEPLPFAEDDARV